MYNDLIILWSCDKIDKKKLLSSKISQTYVHSIDIQGENVKILIFQFC